MLFPARLRLPDSLCLATSLRLSPPAKPSFLIRAGFPIHHVFATISDVFFSIPNIFYFIFLTPLMLSIPHIFFAIHDIFPTISCILLPICSAHRRPSHPGRISRTGSRRIHSGPVPRPCPLRISHSFAWWIISRRVSGTYTARIKTRRISHSFTRHIPLHIVPVFLHRLHILLHLLHILLMKRSKLPAQLISFSGISGLHRCLNLIT